MSCLGVHFALTRDAARLRAFEDEQERLEFVTDIKGRHFAPLRSLLTVASPNDLA